jgi:hypothetical protein
MQKYLLATTLSLCVLLAACASTENSAAEKEMMKVPTYHLAFSYPEPLIGPVDTGDGYSFSSKTESSALVVQQRKYDQEIGGVFDWQFKNHYQEFLQKPSCDLFVDSYLPVDLQRTHLCELVATQNGGYAFTVVGFGVTFESLDYINTAIILPTKQNVVLLEPARQFPQSDADVEHTLTAFQHAHPSIDYAWATPHFPDLMKVAEQAVNKELTNPTQEILDAQKRLRALAATIRIK